MRDRPANWRLLTPEQEVAVRKLYLDGVPARDIASSYGVTVRTIYRTLHRTNRAVLTAKVGDYYALYEVGEEGPVQLTPWRAA